MPESTDERGRLTFRRLLLAKQLYLHGVDHSHKAGPLNKMIAVHNLHNAIEIVLRAIFLHHEIRIDRELNIEFEVMLNQIDQHQSFREDGIRLPYRQELRNLNQLRNHVQHHAIEPESATMEYWRVFTDEFLKSVCQTYFDVDFSALSPLDYIDNEIIRELLRESLSCIEDGNLKKSLVLSKVAFDWSASTIFSEVPELLLSPDFSISIEDHRTRLWQALFGLAEGTKRAVFYAALLSSGISLADLKRFKMYTDDVIVNFSYSGRPEVIWRTGDEPEEDSTKWVHDFVVNTIVHWQTLGFKPNVPSLGRDAATHLIEGL